MTTLVTRARLLSTVLRTADIRRIRRISARFGAREFADVLPALDHLELRRLASALFANEALEDTIGTLESESLARLMLAAHPSDLERALEALVDSEESRSNSVLLALPRKARYLALEHVESSVRQALVKRLPRRARPKTEDKSLLTVLRLRRLFA